jgi:ABC-2 type transport system permease protein
MKNILTITKKELKDYFISPIAYVVIAVFIAVCGIWFAKEVFSENRADMRNIFTFIPLLLIIAIPALTMRSWAEEKREGTLEIITTLPISKIELIIAKFVSTLAFTTLMIIATLPIPITLNVLGNPDNGIIIAGYIGLILLSATYIMIGQFVSINTQNQIVAFILASVLIAILYVIGEVNFLEVIPSALREYFQALGLGSHFRSIARGVIDTRDILYYFSIIIILFVFTYKSLDRIKRIGK